MQAQSFAPGTESRSARLRALTARLTQTEVNGEPAILVHESGELTVVLVPEILDGRISTVRAILNPDKLAYVRAQLET